jgi:hypothetical protein
MGVVMLAISGASTQAAQARHGQLVQASGRLGGLTGGQLLGEEFRQIIELPLAENPLAADLPAPNILGVPERETTFVAAAWVAMIRPLPPGTHTIRVETVDPDGASDVREVIVEVGRR